VPSQPATVATTGTRAALVGRVVPGDLIETRVWRGGATIFMRAIHHTQRHLAVTAQEVRRNFARYGLLDDRVRFLEGWFVRAFAALLEPGGSADVSLPNVRHRQLYWSVGARGTWPRQTVGLFDRTHLRCLARPARTGAGAAPAGQVAGAGRC
jgi:hypothetical protein